MPTIITLVSAYLLAGIYGVVLDLRQPAYDRPAYIRKGGLIFLAGAVLLWLPMLVLSLVSMGRAQSKDVWLFVVFVLLSAFGLYIGRD